MYIPVILGTAREGRQSEKAANYMVAQAEKAGLETELLDVRDYRVSATAEESEAQERYSEKMKRADGLLIVTPEYNHGYPGELKMMMDMLYEEYNGKPVGLCGVSAGGMGGARVVEVLRIHVIELQMVPIREAMYFSKVHELFNEDGSIKDPSYEERAENFLNQLKQYAEALKAVRS